MTIIYIELIPDEIEIKKIFTTNEEQGDSNSDQMRWSTVIYLKGKPTHNGTYKHTGFELTNGDKKINLPEIFSIRITEKDESLISNSAIGRLYYFAAQDDWELGDRPDELHADIKVNSIHFKDYISLIKSRKFKLIASVSFHGDTVDGSLKSCDMGYDVTWDISKSNKIRIECFYFNTLFKNEVSKETEEYEKGEAQESQLNDNHSLILSQLASHEIALKKITKPIWLIFIVLCFFLIKLVL